MPKKTNWEKQLERYNPFTKTIGESNREGSHRHVKDYMELAYGERAFMKAKNGKRIKIRRTKSGDFALGWNEKSRRSR